ncbi:MAG: hypothetical protein Q8L86_19640 [Vicinamibacterales bacterium]|nr:hypothetical protein [Vicinamibacterales bacterium]
MTRRGGAAGLLAAAVVMALGMIVADARQQSRLPLSPGAPSGAGVAPYFDGWYANPDGTFTLSFGFMNRNTREVVDIPIGDRNRIEPEEFDGRQPTHFPPVSYTGFGGRRERGAFAVRVPAGFRGDVVWTLTHNGFTYSVPGRARDSAYELSYTPQAAGSLMPIVRFAPDGPPSQGREGVTSEPQTAMVGRPLAIRIWMEDRGERKPIPTSMTWFKYQGPGEVAFEPRTARTAPGGGEATTMATFSAPGDYMLRVRVDNFGITDSAPGHQCCWTNGYVRVTVDGGR